MQPSFELTEKQAEYIKKLTATVASDTTGTTDGDLYALLVDLGWTDCIV